MKTPIQMFKCKHNFKHEIIAGESVNGRKGYWLGHVCKKCGLAVSGGRIEFFDKFLEEKKWK